MKQHSSCTYKFFLLSFLSSSFDWAIPENIHTIPRMACRISEGEGGSGLWNSEGMGGGVFTIGNLKAWVNSTGGISGVESVE